MATSVLLVTLGLLSVAFAEDPTGSTPSDKTLDAGNPVMDLFHHLTCLDGSCDLVASAELLQVTSKPDPIKVEEPIAPVHAKAASPAPAETDRELQYVEECVHFLVETEAFQKDPKIVAFVDDYSAYYQHVISVYNQNPDKRSQIMIEVLAETIQLLSKLKQQYESESVTCQPQTTPAQPITEEPVEEIIAEEGDIYPPFVGSVRGIPGVHYPNYTEVPITSFSCGEQEYIPGFYADIETRCQVFHVCYEHRRESFLCPIGTTFNQPILACDYWYSSNCSLSSHYYDVNAKKPEQVVPEPEKEEVQQIITTIIEQERPVMPSFQVKTEETKILKSELQQIVKFLPVKAKILEFPRVPAQPMPLPQVDPKFVAAALPIVQAKLAVAAAVPAFQAGVATGVGAAAIAGKTKVAGAALGLSSAGIVGKKKVAGAALGLSSAGIVGKKKVAGAALGLGAAGIAGKKIAGATLGLGAASIAGKKKVAAGAAVGLGAAGIAGKKKVAGAALALGVAGKSKVVAAGVGKAVAAAIVKPKVAAVTKGVGVAAAKKLAIPLAKAKTVPVLKAAKAIPLVKAATVKSKIALGKGVAVPLLKTKALMISPLTKKALALGAIKLLKAKKLALMG